MLTSIDVDSDNSFSVPILGVSPKDSILVRKVDGLGPPDINLFIGDYSRDGGIYQGRRVGSRFPVFTMELNPNPALGETVASLREDLYKAFVDPLVDADYVKIGLHFDDGRLLYLIGYTEKFETDIFSTETLAQISMICPDPYIRDDTPTVLTHPTGWTTIPFEYNGTAETGFEVSIHVNTATPRLILDNNSTTDDPGSSNYYRGRMILDYPFSVGDVVTINTIRGARRIWLTPTSGPVVSIISALTPLSRWIELHSQSNTVRIYGATPADLPASIRSISYLQAWWGI